MFTIEAPNSCSVKLNSEIGWIKLIWIQIGEEAFMGFTSLRHKIIIYIIQRIFCFCWQFAILWLEL